MRGRSITSVPLTGSRGVTESGGRAAPHRLLAVAAKVRHANSLLARSRAEPARSGHRSVPIAGLVGLPSESAGDSRLSLRSGYLPRHPGAAARHVLCAVRPPARLCGRLDGTTSCLRVARHARMPDRELPSRVTLGAA